MTETTLNERWGARVSRRLRFLGVSDENSLQGIGRPGRISTTESLVHSSSFNK